MVVHSPAAYGMFSHDVALSEVVQILNAAGFGNEDICMMLSPTHPISAVVRDASLFNTEREASAATAGLIGWLSEFGAVVIPTVGFFVRSQAFFHALVAAKDSPALCGHSGTLVGLGLSATDAQRYENQLRDVGVLVYISCPVSARTNWAVELLRRTGAQEVASVAEAGATMGVPSVEEIAATMGAAAA
jgi:hypothetical protein